jgi:hypothetical protein
MFKRLFVLMLLALTTLPVSTPAHATPIGVSVYCYQTGVQWPWYAYYRCGAGVNGGTGSYTYTWKGATRSGGSTCS